MSDNDFLLLASRGSSPKPAVIMRPPLVFPRCDSCPSAFSYDKVLPWTPPKVRDYINADAWGVPIVDTQGRSLLPFVAEGSSEHPERLITAFLYKYDHKLWSKCFDEHLGRGYTHWPLWWPNARADGMSIPDFVKMCKEIQAAGFYTQPGLNSKDYDRRDMSPAEWRAQMDPFFDAMGRARAADEFAVWEWNSHNVPGQPTIESFGYFGKRATDMGASFWAHFFPGYVSWEASGDSRGEHGFWSDLRSLGPLVRGLQYQAEPSWDIGDTQSRLVDVMRMFHGMDDAFIVRAFELKALLRFTRDEWDEAAATAYGYLACCTLGEQRVWGTADSFCLPDGSPIRWA